MRSGIAFSTNVPHTVRGGPPHTREMRDPNVHRHLPSETKTCTDCHVAAANNNNAYMATLLMQGSNFGALLGPPITAALVSADGWPAAAWLTSTALGTVAASGIFLHRRERRKVDT